MKPNLPSLLTFNGGYVDTAGFLALQGLFTAHVTGNFVTLGATLVAGSTGAIAKLLALPVFCGVVLAAGVARRLMLRAHAPALKILLGAQWLLLVAGAALAIRLGPFANGDAWPAIATGMALVMAMAIQNAVHRLHLSERIAGDAVPVRGSPARLANMAWTVVTFALGCAAAALAYLLGGAWAFALPPVLIAFALFLGDERKLEHAL
ncbi:putative permease [Burkholderia pseudomallei]|nr:putative permease [Burkholderia pseudomallei]